MKRGKKRENDIKEVQEYIASEFVSPCPQCGNIHTTFEVNFDEVEWVYPISIDIVCSDCGRSTVNYNRKDDEWTSSDGAPYLPYEEDICLTLYHRFDTYSYDSEKEAVSKETELIERCMNLHSLEDDDLLQEMDSRLSELYERGYQLGIDLMVSKYIIRLIQDFFTDEPDEDIDPLIDRCLLIMEHADFLELCIILSIVKGMESMNGKLRRISDEAISRILFEVKGMTGKEGDSDSLLAAEFAFKQFNDPIGKELLDKAISFEMKIPDIEEREHKLAFIYSLHIPYLPPGPQMEEEMLLLDRYRESFPIKYVGAAMYYLDVNEFDERTKDAALDKIDFVLEYLYDYVEVNCDADDFENIYERDRMRILHIRYQITSNVKDLVEAAEQALECISLDDDEEAEILLKEFLDDPKMPKKVNKKLYMKALEFGVQFN